MRTLKIILVLIAVVLSGFSKDSQRTKAGVAVPFRFEGVIIPDLSTPLCNGFGPHESGLLQGYQTHGGRLITEQSTWITSGCSIDFTTMVMTSTIEGVNTVANGDSYSYSCVMYTNIVNGSMTLNVTVTSGTGRFEGATGHTVLTGAFAEYGIPVSGWGSITFSK